MWTYRQTNGALSHNGTILGGGYSGKGLGKNSPTFQHVPNMGPIPQGRYTIEGPRDTPTHGPYVLPLVPEPLNLMYGRSGFLIHGDSLHAPGTASEGCIILDHALRVQIWESGDHHIEVIA